MSDSGVTLENEMAACSFPAICPLFYECVSITDYISQGRWYARLVFHKLEIIRKERWLLRLHRSISPELTCRDKEILRNSSRKIGDLFENNNMSPPAVNQQYLRHANLL
jgi:hypothetical protein